MPIVPDLDVFRARCRSFFDGLAVEPISGPDPRGDRALVIARLVQGRLVEAGLAGITYPVEYGGQGLTAAHEQVWREEYGRGPDLLSPLKISHGMCLPMLNEFGTAQQKARYLARNIRAEDLWCQMFSEPGAGSDVAGLRMQAERDGDQVLRQDVVRLYSEETVKSIAAALVRAAIEVGHSPGPIGSLGKLQGARIARMTRERARPVDDRLARAKVEAGRSST